MSGQIGRDSDFGKKIYELCKLEHVNTIVEIGTWNGQGSTKCVMDALIEKITEKTEFYSLEANKEMYEKAKIYWDNFLSLRNFIIKEKIILLHGKIIEKNDLMSIEELKKLVDYDSRWDIWLEEDKKSLDSCKNVLKQIPEKIDLLILDGGEFSTLAEFKILGKRSKYIACDDTRMLKCREIRNILLKDEQHVCLVDNQNERNGFSIFKKLDSSLG